MKCKRIYVGGKIRLSSNCRLLILPRSGKYLGSTMHGLFFLGRQFTFHYVKCIYQTTVMLFAFLRQGLMLSILGEKSSRR